MMGIIRKQSFFSSIILYIGMAFGFVLILFVYPKYLSPEEIGLVRVIIDIAALLSPYILLGV
ncbi:MAG: lipopolysaccharide biosynthesis protein, partial [Salibacteraceae bacterium]|nr:lipopolysaccharide biosynthesis protein [Salibacteraceae bacterium]